MGEPWKKVSRPPWHRDGLSWTSQIQPKSLQEDSQNVQNRFWTRLSMPTEEKCVQGGLWDKFGTHLGHPLGGHLGRKNGPEAVQNRFLFTTKLKQRFRKVLGCFPKRFGAWFYALCRSDRTHNSSDTVTINIFKNIYVFTVKLHIHMVE